MSPCVVHCSSSSSLVYVLNVFLNLFVPYFTPKSISAATYSMVSPDYSNSYFILAHLSHVYQSQIFDPRVHLYTFHVADTDILLFLVLNSNKHSMKQGINIVIESVFENSVWKHPNSRSPVNSLSSKWSLVVMVLYLIIWFQKVLL